MFLKVKSVPTTYLLLNRTGNTWEKGVNLMYGSWNWENILWTMCGLIWGADLRLWSNLLWYKDQRTKHFLSCTLLQKPCSSQIDFNLLTDKHFEAGILWQSAESWSVPYLMDTQRLLRVSCYVEVQISRNGIHNLFHGNMDMATWAVVSAPSASLPVALAAWWGWHAGWRGCHP